MMGRQSRQMAMIFVDIESLIPETHLLRKIERMVSFNFIYDLLAPYYPATGRPSVDPVSMFKMLLIGYLYGIKSERRLVEEVQLNIAYRWFCGFELDDTIPNHSDQNTKMAAKRSLSESLLFTYHRLNCSKSTGKYLRCYQVEGDACMRCPKRPSCFDKAGIRRRVLASSCYPAFFRGHQRVGTPEYLALPLWP